MPGVRALLGRYPTTMAIHSGAVAAPAITLDIADVAVPNRAFKRVVRELEFDVAELALMTYLMARSRGAPLSLLPVVLFSRNPLPLLVKRSADAATTPTSLAGRRIGVRSYTTTTAVWARRLLRDEYGSDVDRARWLTLDEGHVANVPDPPGVERANAAGDLATWLRDDTIDTALVDPTPTDAAFTSLVPNADAAWHAWRHRTKATTVNHVVVVRDALATEERRMRDLFELFRRSRQLGGGAVDQDSTPFGFEANRRNLEVAIETADAEGLLARPLSIADLVPATLQLS